MKRSLDWMVILNGLFIESRGRLLSNDLIFQRYTHVPICAFLYHKVNFDHLMSRKTPTALLELLRRSLSCAYYFFNFHRLDFAANVRKRENGAPLKKLRPRFKIDDGQMVFSNLISFRWQILGDTLFLPVIFREWGIFSALPPTVINCISHVSFCYKFCIFFFQIHCAINNL